MRVYPKRPKCVIQIEYQHLGKGQSIAECIWSNTLLKHNASIRRFQLLCGLFDHIRDQEHNGGQDDKLQYEITKIE